LHGRLDDEAQFTLWISSESGKRKFSNKRFLCR
jgi:hypothetical protein